MMAAFSKAQDLHKRLFFVLLVFVIYRLGTHIPLPGVDATALSVYADQLKQGALGMFNMFTGGAFSRMAIFALNIMPYISASIIMQLVGFVSPQIAEMRKEGGAGQRRISQYTRYLTIAIALVQGVGLGFAIEKETVQIGTESVALVADPGMMFIVQTALTLMAGSVFVMWLGEQITQRGVGQGASLLIFAGIVAELPAAFAQTFELTKVGTFSLFFVLFLAVLVLAVIFFITYMEMAQRRLLVQYPKRQVSQSRAVGGQSSYFPIKFNMAGVMPAIFASSLLLVPTTIVGMNADSEMAQIIGAYFTPGKPIYTAAFVVMIVFFCFFYTAMQFNPAERAEELARHGGYIGGLRPGKNTEKYLDFVVTRLTVVGAAYISLICILPEIMNAQFNVPFYFGGTSLLIIVSVTLHTVGDIQSHLLSHSYEGLIKKAKLRKKRS